MDSSTFNEYLEKRYYDQLKYYETASRKNQQRYKYFQWILIILSTLTTILAALPQDKFNVQFLLVITAAAVTILTSGLKTFQYQELWVTYRTTLEQLKPEIFYYYFNVGEYGQEGVDKESTFVTRIEQILNKEHDVWPIAKKPKDRDNQDLPQNDEEQKKLDKRIRERFNPQKDEQENTTTENNLPGESPDTTEPNEIPDTVQEEDTTGNGQPDMPGESTDENLDNLSEGETGNNQMGKIK